MKKQISEIYSELDNIDQLILSYLKEGLNQVEISQILKKSDVKPNSLSIIEKRLKAIKEKFNAKTNFHLAIILYSK